MLRDPPMCGSGLGVRATLKSFGTDMPSRVSVRSVRDSVAVFGVGACALLYVILTLNDPIAGGGTGRALVWFLSAVLGVGACWLCARSWVMGVSVSAEEIVFVNFLRSIRVPTSEVTTFATGRLRILNRPAVVALTRDGRTLTSGPLSASPVDMLTNSNRVQHFVGVLNTHLDEARLRGS